MINRDLCNTKVMYIQAFGMKVPLDETTFIQVNPNNGEVIQKIAMKEVINLLVRHNMHGGIKENEND